MNISTLYIVNALVIVALIIYGFWLHDYTKEVYDKIEMLYNNADYVDVGIEELRAELAEIKKVLPTPKRPAKYDLSDAERQEIECALQDEAGGEDWTGRVLVAQCILNTCEKYNIRPIDVLDTYKYAPGVSAPSDLTKAAVRYVFDEGQCATELPVLYFYAPKICQSEWHESQVYLLEHGNHRFFGAR